MLKKLVVKDFAIIEDVSIDFSDNMTVLTGETGAGKSLIIDTISLILAARADQSMIRYGAKFAYIEGEFTNYGDNVKELLDKYGIKENGSITILREIYDTSKNTIKINGQNVTLTILKMISSLLADLHTQNDTYRLFNKESYLSLVDPKDDEKFNKLLSSYIMDLEKYNSSIKEYEHILKGQKETLDRLEFLQYEQQELSSLELEENIDVELEEKISKLSNFDKIFNALNEAKRCLDGEISAIDSLYDASKYMEKIASYDNEYNDMASKLLDSYYIIDEVNSNLAYHIRNLDYDEEELDMLVSRLNEINKAKDKYKKSVKELIEYLKKITLDINMVIDYDNVLNESKNKVINAHKKLIDSANKLSSYRKKLAKEISSGIIKECKDLDLENTQFEIEFTNPDYINPFNKSIYLPNGIDEVDFKVSFNKGEPPHSLSKVASGGEMSRMMLSFKSYFSRVNPIGLMVFDEIDTGVSGATAKKIAIKMKEIANRTQVLCITHLPQVAAIGNHHKHIYKVLEDGRTKTHVKDLNYDERKEEIAMMLSGDKMSLYALEHAKALLEE